MFGKLAIVATVGAGLAIGFLWPSPQRSKAALASETGIEVVLERNSDDHFYTDAQVNGHDIHFMIDTGASETALTEDDAKAAGLNIDRSKYEVIGDGASGILRGQYVQLKSIDVSGIRQQDAQAVVVEGADVSLLGQPFLKRVDEIVIRKDEMRLKQDPHS